MVDDASKQNITLPNPSKLLKNHERKLLAYSRNRGARESKGELLFFLDDDNVISEDAITELVRVINQTEQVGVVMPVIYHFNQPNKVWTYYFTRSSFPAFFVINRDSPLCDKETFSFHNSFLVKRKVFEKVGGFDEFGFPIHFSEHDFAFKMHKLGYNAIVVSKAKVWHDIGEINRPDKVRAYYMLRNKIILIKKHYNSLDLLFYLFCILPLFILYYIRCYSVMKNRISMTKNLLKGIIDGIVYHQPFIRPKIPILPLLKIPLVSVIIPTKNSGKTLAKCLTSLKNQTYSNIEVVVVDNFSKDKTRDIAKSFGANVYTAGPERSAQFNVGASMAKGEYIYRIDSDFIVEPTVIEEAVRACEIKGCDIVAVHNTPDPEISFWSKVRKLEKDCYINDIVYVGSRFFRKSAFNSVNGFDESLIASEDYDIHKRLVAKGFKLGRIKAQEVHIGEPKTLKEVVKVHVYYGKTINRYMKKHQHSLMELSPARSAYIRHLKDFFKNPKVTLGFFIYQYVRYMSVLAGFLSKS